MKTFVAFLSFLLSSCVSCADSIVGGHVQAFQSADTSISSSEYYWSSGSFSGFGLIDTSRGDYFTNHEVSLNHEYLFVTTEVGRSNAGQITKWGVGFDATPLLSDSFDFVRVSALSSDSDADQVKVAWQSRGVRLGKDVEVYTSGFVRIKDGAPDVLQPEIWLRSTDTPLEVGIRGFVLGGDATFYLGLRLRL